MVRKKTITTESDPCVIDLQTADPQAYISKRGTLIQVLPLLKVFCYLLMHICFAYTKSVRIVSEIEERKYLNG